MYAVVKTGGKQVKVEMDATAVVEKLDAAVGDTIDLPVLLVIDGDRTLVGAKDLAGASVTAEIVEHFRDEKVIVFKFKKRKGYKRTKGHRQDKTRVRITDITVTGKPAAKAAAKPAEDTVEAAPKAAEKKPAAAKKPAAKAAAATKKPAAAKKPASKAATAAKKPAAKKPAAKKPATKKTEAE